MTTSRRSTGRAPDARAGEARTWGWFSETMGGAGQAVGGRVRHERRGAKRAGVASNVCVPVRAGESGDRRNALGRPRVLAEAGWRVRSFRRQQLWRTALNTGDPR